MIKRFIERFENRKSELQAIWSEKHPEDYKEIVTEVVKILKPTEEEQNNKEWHYPYKADAEAVGQWPGVEVVDDIQIVGRG